MIKQQQPKENEIKNENGSIDKEYLNFLEEQENMYKDEQLDFLEKQNEGYKMLIDKELEKKNPDIEKIRNFWNNYRSNLEKIETNNL